MKKHVKIYYEAHGFHRGDYIPCCVCYEPAVDIHHIDARGIGGSCEKDMPDNLIALCRKCHIEYGDKKQFKEFLRSKIRKNKK